MKDNELLFDLKSHVLYSRPCKKVIRAKIALHYPEAERETIWERVQRQYADFLSDWRTDLGSKRNFHNGVRTSCPPCVMWTLRLWSFSMQGLYGRTPA